MPQALPLRSRLRRSFDRAASGYDAVASVPREIAARMIERLALVRIPIRMIVDAGSGTGYAANLLRQKYRNATVLELDLSEQMLRQSQRHLPRKWGWFERRLSGSAVCGDIKEMPLASDSVDLVWSNLALHWVDELPAAMAQIRRILRNGGLLTFSMFGPDTLRELRQIGTGGELRVNAQIDMHDIGDMLVHAGFGEPVMDMEYLTLTYENLPALIQDLRAHGSVARASRRSSGLGGAGDYVRLRERYERLRRADGRLPATFEIIYGHAWKPAERRSPAGKPIIEIKRR